MTQKACATPDCLYMLETSDQIRVCLCHCWRSEAIKTYQKHHDQMIPVDDGAFGIEYVSSVLVRTLDHNLLRLERSSLLVC